MRQARGILKKGAAAAVATNLKLHAASAWHLEQENVGNDKNCHWGD
ncbi:MAG: hypothetical protein ACREU0_10220 [Burkholderiales bacterium]